MPPMLSSVYDALLTSGTSPEVARKAAEHAALYDSRQTRMEAGVENLTHRLTVLTWTMGVGFWLVLAMLLLALYWMWPLIQRLR
jgi:hypothetical protein